jgi:hypothetical protein
MAQRLRLNDRTLFTIAAALLLCAVVVAVRGPSPTAILVLPVLSSILLLAALLEVYRRLRDDRRSDAVRRDWDFRQVEALTSLFATLKPDRPLPATRGWAASPDFLKLIVEQILLERPRLVVEASSGVSTLVIGYCLKRLGRGRLVSLEHEAQFVALARERIVMHGLEEFATVVHAPLVSVEIEGGEWPWYDLRNLPAGDSIDLLVVDGPPGQLRPLARYPALPLLYRRLSDRATVLLDDGNRVDEKEIVGRWEREFGDLSVEFRNVEKGAFVLRRGRELAPPVESF